MKIVFVLILILTPYGSFKTGVRNAVSTHIVIENVAENREDCDLQGSIAAQKLGNSVNVVEYVCIRKLINEKFFIRGSQE